MAINEEEQRTRREAWSFAIASVELEGLKLPDCATPLIALHIDGDMDAQQLNKAIFKLCGINVKSGAEN